MTKKIDEATLTILSRVTVKGNLVELTCGQLDRKQYVLVNSILEAMGGKWDRKSKAHVFSKDPTDKLEIVLLTGEIMPPEDYGYFPTPEDIADEVIARAGIRPGMKVLEPSAGQGALAGPAAEIVGMQDVHCVELLEDNCKILRQKGFTVQQGDFCGLPKIQPVFDRVIMNPPFSRQQDIDHVLHAWSFLKSGGRLVSIMSAGVLFRDNKKTIRFKELANGCGNIERLPEDSFKASGTNVSTALVIMDKL